MTHAEKLFHQIAEELPDAKEGKMFGALCIKVANEKCAAMFWKECMVVKLGSEIMKEALNLKGAQLFEPMQGRQMKEWVQIPFEHKDKWKTFASISLKQVKTLKK